MKNSKKGISLIVLVITIIVIIILAAAVLLSLQNNNPIKNANTARDNNDISETQSAVTLYLANYMANNNGKKPIEVSDTFTFKSDSDPAIAALGLPSSITSVKIDKDYRVTEIKITTGSNTTTVTAQ